MSEPISVFFLTSEISPVAKTGGLADISASLPAALMGIPGEEIDVRIGTVGFRGVEKIPGFSLRKTFVVRTPAGVRTVRVFEGRSERSGVPVYAVDPEGLFDRPGLYGERGREYPDNLERFSIWNHALLHLPSVLDFSPDLLHANDWQTALSIPLLPHIMRTRQRERPVKTLLSIHNMAYQGVYPLDHWRWTGLPSYYNNFDGLEYHGQLSLLKGGIQFADAISTVSPSYRDEVLSEPGGHGLSGALRHREEVFNGILNGIDAEEWDPSTDPHLPIHYSARELEKKDLLKQVLKERWGFFTPATRPLFGVVSRLVWQKGLGILADALSSFPRGTDLQSDWILLGSGDPTLEEKWRDLEESFPGQVRVRIGFDERMSHQIMGASDFQVIPSVYEPCGLTQMYAMRYGTLPIVNPTGGLKDTVFHEMTGFCLEELSVDGMRHAMNHAASVFRDRKKMTDIRKRAMAVDSSWNERATEYVGFYRSILSAPPYHNPLLD